MTCFDRVQSLHLEMAVIFCFCNRRTRVIDKILCTTHVIKCHVKSTIHGCGDVECRMCITRLVGDECFFKIVDKIVYVHREFSCSVYAICASIGTL